jgi:hypothetical protein
MSTWHGLSLPCLALLSIVYAVIPPSVQSETALAALGQEHKSEQNRLVATSAAPEKARRQADLAVADVKSAQQLLAAADTKLLEVEAAARAAHDRERELQVSYAPAALMSRHLRACLHNCCADHCVAVLHGWCSMGLKCVGVCYLAYCCMCVVPTGWLWMLSTGGLLELQQRCGLIQDLTSHS